MLSGQRFTWQIIAGGVFLVTIVIMRSATLHHVDVAGIARDVADRGSALTKGFFEPVEEEQDGDFGEEIIFEEEHPIRKNLLKEQERGRMKTYDFITATDLLQFRKGKTGVKLEDETLLQFIRSQIAAPSTEPLHLFESHELDQSQAGQSKRVDEILNGRMNGFYLECGAATGEGRSNSLFFERARDWGGLLIEADPKAFNALLLRNRHAYTINSCLSPANSTRVMKFNVAGEGGGLVGTERLGPGDRLSSGKGYVSEVQCFPIYSVLLALNVKHIDYFSLDVEGAEVSILETFPWGTITVDVWTVEYRTFNNSHLSLSMTVDRYNEIKAVFDATGLYEPVGVLPPSEPLQTGLDAVFKRKQLAGAQRNRDSNW